MSPGARLLLLLALLVGCAGGRGLFGSGPLRLSELADAGDPARRASLRLCIDGLDADAQGRLQAAASNYERAIQIDPTNPYAYLALARHAVEAGDAERALATLDRAEALLGAQEMRSPGVEAHLLGLRGVAFVLQGRDGGILLARAHQLAPEIWNDRFLSANELR